MVLPEEAPEGEAGEAVAEEDGVRHQLIKERRKNLTRGNIIFAVDRFGTAMAGLGRSSWLVRGRKLGIVISLWAGWRTVTIFHVLMIEYPRDAKPSNGYDS